MLQEYYWLIFSLIVAALFALVNTFDKSVVYRSIRSPIVITCFVGLIGIIPTVLIFIAFLYYQVPIPELYIILISMFLGSLFTLFTFMYFKALSNVPVDVVVGTLQLSVICSVIWGYFVFNESFGELTYAGITIVVVFLFILSVYRSFSRKSKAKRFPIEVLFAVVAAVLLSIGFAFQKSLTFCTNPWVIFFYSRLGNLLTIFILFLSIPNLRQQTFRYMNKYKMKLGYIIFVEMIYYSTIIIRLFAVSLGFLTTVATFVTAQPLFVTLYAFIQERFGVSDQQYRGQNFLLRSSLVMMIVIGGGLIAWDHNSHNSNHVKDEQQKHKTQVIQHCRSLVAS